MKTEWTILQTNLLGSYLWCRTQLSDFTFTFHFHALEKEMATHSSVRAWRIPGMVEPGGLPSVGSHRVGHDWSDLAAAAPFVMCYLTLDSIFHFFFFYWHSYGYHLLYGLKWICWYFKLSHFRGFSDGAVIKNLPAIQETQETWVWSLGWEDTLEKGMAATHSSILAWEIPWTEDPWGLQFIGSQRVRGDWSDWACTQHSFWYFHFY